MEKIALLVVLVLTGAYLVRRFRSAVRGGGCSCGCSECASGCPEKEESHGRESR